MQSKKAAILNFYDRSSMIGLTTGHISLTNEKHRYVRSLDATH